MADITLVKQNPMHVSDEDRATVNRVLCGVVDGLGELGKKQWRNFLSGLLKLEPGEIVSIKTHKARSGRFHRRHMAIETAVFEAQDRFTVFDQYLYWIKVGSGWVVWAAGSKGGVATNIPNRAARIKCIGNGQVPQCAATAFLVLVERLEALHG